MEKIYEQAKDLHVKSYVVYTGKHTFAEQEPLLVNATTLFKDPDRLELADPDEVHDAFVKGILLIRGDSATNPIDDNYLFKPDGERLVNQVVGISGNISVKGYELMVIGGFSWIMFSSIEIDGGGDR